MAECRVPGPTDLERADRPVQDGTLPCRASSPPGPVLGSPEQAACARPHVPPAPDPRIDALGLADSARVGAYALRAAYPAAALVSGRRGAEEQARAMAPWVRSDRDYIRNKHVDCAATRRLQKWVDDHPENVSLEAIQQGLLKVMLTLSEDQLQGLSLHLTGRAFDMLPAQEEAQHVTQTIMRLPGLTKFCIEKRDELPDVWHLQF